MAEWIVSLHGAFFSYASAVKSTGGYGGRTSFVRVPSGCRIYFYGPEGQILPVDQGWTVFRLLTGTPPEIATGRKCSTEVAEAGSMVRNYYLSGDDSWTDGNGSASGIFMVGNRFSAGNWLATAATQWDLEFVLKTLNPGDSLHWLACRVAT